MSAFRDAVEGTALVDHHVHGALREQVSRSRFEGMLNEGYPGVPPADMQPLDSQIGFAVRRWCAPLLGLEAGAPADEYWATRDALGEQEVNRRLLGAAGVSHWLVDTGHGADVVLGPDELAAFAGTAREIVRIEVVAERLAASGVAPADYADSFRSALAAATATAVGVKSVLAYRSGFDIDLTRPSDAAVGSAAARWLSGAGAAPRLDDPVLLAFGLHAALERGLPIQLHVGFGDRDLDLRTANPLLLRPFLLAAECAEVPVLLLHCYPYEREAGYLAQSYGTVYLDVGLAVNYLGAASPTVIAHALETAPFSRVLYSSDAWGPAELHLLGARLWRTGLERVVAPWIESGEWRLDDAVRVQEQLGRGTALRVYGL
jgi:predicted TIM-barrel fold metal-dependent hydrolase